MARIQGAGLSIATDLSDLRLNTAKGLYADVTINASKVGVEDRIQRIKEMTEGVALTWSLNRRVKQTSSLKHCAWCEKVVR